MLDLKRIRKNPEEINELLQRRNVELSINNVLKLDERRRALLLDVEEMKAEQNKVSKEIPSMKKDGLDVTPVLEEMKQLSIKIKELDLQVKEVDTEINNELLCIPNIPNPDITVGTTEEDNKEIRKWKEPRKFEFEIKPHWDLGTELEILDFERAAKITGARFSMFKGIGAKLERALISFMLDVHTEEHGFTEISPPFMVNRESMIGTGQLPKFEEDVFKIPQKDFYLIPTAEVPVTNIYRDEILEENDLPYYMTAYTPCFRSEAGSAGRDTRGLIRNHQFDKVEMVMLARPEESYEELEKLTGYAETILQKLGLPYRVIELCTGDIGFSSAKTYDLEVWMPSYNRYVEISSCSNFEDFQARRANLRYKPADNGKPRFLHTLNGSGLAVGRTFAAILENYQNEDGTITIPEVLRKYLGGIEKIEL
ncbi:MAG: serine--tRNA ligase [Tissierellales bacterium]|nr:serine--tRNA ligase [Tissierellales bacterium]MBN2827191.1 serine--tRNA ligase [Tissierellales bacterium]